MKIAAALGFIGLSALIGVSSHAAPYKAPVAKVSKPVTVSKPVSAPSPKYGPCGNGPCTSVSQADMRYNNPSLASKYSVPVRSNHSANDCKPVCHRIPTVGGLSIMNPRAQIFETGMRSRPGPGGTTIWYKTGR